jgi:hypothetical protein
VLEVAAASPDVTVERFFAVNAQLSDLVKQYKLAYLSQTGIQPTTEPAAGLPEGTGTGEYYIDGHVPRVGVYSLTGRKISVKQAIVAAGGIEPGFTRARITIIRRDAKDKDHVVMDQVPLDDIFSGKHDDVFLRPNDIVRVAADPAPGDGAAAPASRPATTAPSAGTTLDRSAVRIAQSDPTMRLYLQQLDAMQFDLERLKRNVGPQNRVLLDRAADVELQKRRINSYAKVYRRASATTLP